MHASIHSYTHQTLWDCYQNWENPKLQLSDLATETEACLVIRCELSTFNRKPYAMDDSRYATWKARCLASIMEFSGTAFFTTPIGTKRPREYVVIKPCLGFVLGWGW